MSEWKLRRTLQCERWRVDVNVSLPGSGEFSSYAACAVCFEPHRSPRRTCYRNANLSYLLPRTMNVAEKINKQVQRLPEQTQAEVLDFVEYLLTKSERDQTQNEEEKWTRLSLASAMRGMEEETDLEYTEEDLEERFSAS